MYHSYALYIVLFNVIYDSKQKLYHTSVAQLFAPKLHRFTVD